MKQTVNCNHIDCHRQYRRRCFWTNFLLVLMFLATAAVASYVAVSLSYGDWRDWHSLALGVIAIGGLVSATLGLVDRRWLLAATYSFASLGTLAAMVVGALVAGDHPGREYVIFTSGDISEVSLAAAAIVVVALAAIGPSLVGLVSLFLAARRTRRKAVEQVVRRCKAREKKATAKAVAAAAQI